MSLDTKARSEQDNPQQKSDVTAADASAVVPTKPLFSKMEEFVCLLGLFFMLRLPWLFMLPMVEAPDEFAHYWVIKFLREHWRLPHAQEVFAAGPSAVYGSMPQLGYIPHVFASLFMPFENIALSGRFGSLLMGSLMLFAAYRIGQLLFKENRLMALALPTAIILHPQLIFLHSYANNDSTSSALASVLILLAFESLVGGITFRRTALMGAIVGWVAITKYSGLAIIPIMGVALIASVIINGTAIGPALTSILGAGVIAAALSIWWFVQNNNEYPGDPMGTKTMYKSWATTFHRDLNYYLPVSHIIKSLRWWRMMYFSFWGMFGYMNKYLWRPVYLVYVGMLILALCGWLNGLRRFVSEKAKTFRFDRTNSKDIVMWSCLALTVLINLASMIWASVHNLGGPQGRYLFTSEIPVMALFVGGLNLLGGKGGGKIAVSIFLAFNLAVAVGSWIYLFNLYGGWHINPL